MKAIPVFLDILLRYIASSNKQRVELGWNALCVQSATVSNSVIKPNLTSTNSIELRRFNGVFYGT